MRGPLVRWAVFSLLSALASMAAIAVEFMYIKYGYGWFKFGFMDFSTPALVLYAAAIVVTAPEWVFIHAMLFSSVYLFTNGYWPGSRVGFMIAIPLFTVAALVLFRYAVWRWGVRRLAAGRPAPYPQMLFLMAGAMTALMAFDYVELASSPPPLSGQMRSSLFHIYYSSMPTFYGIALTLVLFPGLWLLVRNLRRPRLWAGKNDRRCPDVEWKFGKFFEQTDDAPGKGHPVGFAATPPQEGN